MKLSLPKKTSMQLLDGRETAEEIRKELAEAVQERKRNGKKIPHLAAILVGNDGGSLTYVGAKVKACDQIGFESTLIRYDDSVPEEILLAKVKALNEDKSIDGFIVQLPLPKNLPAELMVRPSMPTTQFLRMRFTATWEENVDCSESRSFRWRAWTCCDFKVTPKINFTFNGDCHRC